jgi:hypothetical protein
MAVEPVNGQQPPADAASEAKIDEAIDQAMSQGVLVIGQYMIMPLIKDATSESDAFGDEE